MSARPCPYFGCPIRKSESLLGSFGLVDWYRCRYCGGQFSRDRKPRARRVRKEATP